MSGNPHNFALPTPPSDHENDSSNNLISLKEEKINISLILSILLSAYYMSSLEGIRNTEREKKNMLSLVM